MTSGRGTGDRISLVYRFILRCCPVDFRHEVGDEVLATYRQRCSEIGRADWRSRFIFFLHEATDLAGTALREWRHRLMGTRRFDIRAEWESVTSMDQLRTPPPPPVTLNSREPEMLKNSLNDVRHAIRSMFRRPGFSIVVILTLSIGIGATTAVFSILEGVILRPLPFPEASRLVVPQTIEDGNTYNITINDYLTWREQEVFESVALFGTQRVDITGIGDPVRVMAGFHSHGYFETLQVTPVLGRTFSEEEHLPGGGTPALIGYRFWQRIYGGSQDAIGSDLTARGVTFTVVGVMPPEASALQEEVWVPFQTAQTEPIVQDWDNHAWSAVARLKKGDNLESIRERLAAIASAISAEYPDLRGQESITALPLNDFLTGSQLNRSLWLLFGLVGFVLLIGCVNVANLMLANGSERIGELSIRSALGGRRGRLIRQLLTENLILSITGGVAGILLAHWLIQMILTILPAGVPRLEGVGLNVTVLLFALSASILAVVFFGIVPAFRSTSRGTGIHLGSIKRTATIGRADRRSRNILICAELALSLILLTGAALTLRSLGNLHNVHPGFDHENLLTVEINLPRNTYQSSEAVMQFYDRLHDQVEALPGITSATLQSFLPFQGGGFNLWRAFLAEGRPEPPTGDELSPVPWIVTGDDHFATIGLPVIRGRTFTEFDNTDSAPVIIVSEEFARLMFGEEEALGKKVRSWRDENLYREIVGIVPDIRFLGPADPPRPIAWVPHRQQLWPNMMLVARTTGPPNAAFAPIRDVVRELDPDLPVVGILSMEEALAGTMSGTRSMATLLGVFAITALLLAAVGIFSVLSYVVSTRTREIGVRIAVGADRLSVIRLILQDTLKVTGFGLLIGIVGSQFLGGLLRSQLFEVSPGDPLTLVLVSAILASTAVLAGLLPAYRAATVNPIEALRQE